MSCSECGYVVPAKLRQLGIHLTCIGFSGDGSAVWLCPKCYEAWEAEQAKVKL